MFELDDTEIVQHELVENFSTLYMCLDSLEDTEDPHMDQELYKTLKLTLFKIKYFDLFVHTSPFTNTLSPEVNKFTTRFEETFSNLQMVLPFRRTKSVRVQKLKGIYDEHFADIFKSFLD